MAQFTKGSTGAKSPPILCQACGAWICPLNPVKGLHGSRTPGGKGRKPASLFPRKGDNPKVFWETISTRYPDYSVWADFAPQTRRFLPAVLLRPAWLAQSWWAWDPGLQKLPPKDPISNPPTLPLKGSDSWSFASCVFSTTLPCWAPGRAAWAMARAGGRGGGNLGSSLTAVANGMVSGKSLPSLASVSSFYRRGDWTTRSPRFLLALQLSQRLPNYPDSPS